MKLKLIELEKNLKSELGSIEDQKALELFRIKALGRKSDLVQLSKSLGSLSIEEKKEFGAILNKTKKDIQSGIDELERKIAAKTMQDSLASEAVDVSMPGFYFNKGSVHPISQILNEIIEIFKPLGYSVKSGPEVEHDFFSFEALNIPSDHPAKDMQDTFYIGDDIVLRPHTSPVQIRTMMGQKPPVRILAPGKVYRSDYDVSHTPMFHQIEGLFVDKDVKMSNLKGTLLYFAKKMFGKNSSIRLRPSYFPFTEPSAEVDVTCVMCKGKGCRVCKNTGWVEILGCGMVHPNVFKHVDYCDVTGFAFGMGLERIAMLKYRVDDIRAFFENDTRFLKQFI